MQDTPARAPSYKSLTLLSRLLLSRDKPTSSSGMTLARELLAATRSEFDDLVELASLHHVIVRGLEAFQQVLRETRDAGRIAWVHDALGAERARIANALSFLQRICGVLIAYGYEAAVIKSLDHWPDLGSDLDLFANAPSEEIIALMRHRFDAKLAPRSWGDRLACKWNFLLPGLPEAIEVHVGRLGQTGEQATLAEVLLRRTRTVEMGAYAFCVPSIPDRLMIATLQRMYRHFYFRLCDVADTAALADAEQIDYEELRTAATTVGIWEGSPRIWRLSPTTRESTAVRGSTCRDSYWLQRPSAARWCTSSADFCASPSCRNPQVCIARSLQACCANES